MFAPRQSYSHYAAIVLAQLAIIRAIKKNTAFIVSPRSEPTQRPPSAAQFVFQVRPKLKAHDNKLNNPIKITQNQLNTFPAEFRVNNQNFAVKREKPCQASPPSSCILVSPRPHASQVPSRSRFLVSHGIQTDTMFVQEPDSPNLAQGHTPEPVSAPSRPRILVSHGFQTVSEPARLTTVVEDEHNRLRYLVTSLEAEFDILYSKQITEREAELAILSTRLAEIEAELAILRSKKEELASDVRTRSEQEGELNTIIFYQNAATEAPVSAKNSATVNSTRLPARLGSPISFTDQKCLLVCTCPAECYNTPLSPVPVCRSQNKGCTATPTALEELSDLAPFALGSSSSPTLAACNSELTFSPRPASVPSYTAMRTVARTSPRFLVSRGTSPHVILGNQLASSPSGSLQSAPFEKTTDSAHFSNPNLCIVSPSQFFPPMPNTSPSRPIPRHEVAYSPSKSLQPPPLNIQVNLPAVFSGSKIHKFIKAIWLVAMAGQLPRHSVLLQIVSRAYFAPSRSHK
jgi:hypothetical protein